MANVMIAWVGTSQNVWTSNTPCVPVHMTVCSSSSTLNRWTPNEISSASWSNESIFPSYTPLQVFSKRNLRRTERFNWSAALPVIGAVHDQLTIFNPSLRTSHPTRPMEPFNFTSNTHISILRILHESMVLRERQKELMFVLLDDLGPWFAC
jgi:hypothetical protein